MNSRLTPPVRSTLQRLATSARAAIGASLRVTGAACRCMGGIAKRFRSLWVFGGIAGICAAMLAALTYIAVLPAYTNPKARLFTSSLGYSRVLRSMGKPFPVTAATVTRRRFSEPILGEGLMASRPVMAPIIPIDFITKVHVAAGDHVRAGQLLAELDTTRQQIKVESAELRVSTTLAEADRVRIGSAYVLAQERPQKDQIELEASRKRAEKIKEEQAIYQQLFKDGILSRSKFLELEKQLIEEQKKIQLSEFYLHMSEKGVQKSLLIADNAVEDARRALRHAQEELRHYKIYAPCDGIIERVLISPGEYNQDSGKPAFLMAAGLWFEAHLDQRVITKVSEGQTADVYLEAYPGIPFVGAIERIVPIVSFNLGGPETNRPLRPRGSGGPEWPATFKTQITLAPRNDSAHKHFRLVPGMTGFGQVLARRESMAIPLSCVASLSAGAGFVYVIDDEDQGDWHVEQVRTGAIQDAYIEVLEGLDGDETLISHGFEVLEDTDKIVIDGVYTGLSHEPMR